MTKTPYKLTDEILSDARKSMAKMVDNLIQLKMEDLETYNFPQDEPFGLEVIYGDAPFYMIINFSSKNKNFICMTPGAFRRDRVSSDGEIIEPPHFSRWSWYKFFDESVITCADPMIFWDDIIRIGWMIGDDKQWYIETLSEMIKKLAKNQNVIDDNILFFGSSGGGFVSVCLGTLIKNSKVLVNNAQFSVLNYYKGLVDKALQLTLYNYEGITREELKEKIEYRLNALKLFEKEDYAPNITYYANVKSESDILSHSIPLIQEHYNQNQFNGLTIVYYSEEKSDGKNHHPLPRGLTIEIVKLFAKNNLYNSKPNNKKRMVKEEKYPLRLEKKIKQLKNENKNLKKENSEMKNSHSWKITAPLRKIMRLLKK